jgi:hypothetical protein
MWLYQIYFHTTIKFIYMIIYLYFPFMKFIVKKYLLNTQVRGFKPGRSRRIFRAKKILSMASFGKEVKPSVPCRIFAACKRSLNGVENASFRQNYRTSFSLTVPPFATRSARVFWGGTWMCMAAKVGTFKSREKQWEITRKNLPRMQRARDIPVA